MNLEDLTAEQLKSLEEMIRHQDYNRASEGGVLHHGTIDGLTAEEINAMATEIRTRQYGDAARTTYSDHGSYDKMSAEDIALEEARVGFQNTQNAISGGNDSAIRGNIDSLVRDGDIVSEEARVKFQTQAHAVSGNAFDAYGSVENMDNVSHLEAQVKQQKLDDAWAISYFSGLNQKPLIENPAEFKAAVSRSIQSNRIINKFFEDFTDTLGTKLFALRNVATNETDAIAASKETIERYLNVYGKFMYELKVQEASIDYEALQMPDFIKEAIWQQQRRLGITFAMPIPARYNGQEPFALVGDAVSVINAMNGYTQGFKGQVLGENTQENNGNTSEELMEM